MVLITILSSLRLSISSIAQESTKLKLTQESSIDLLLVASYCINIGLNGSLIKFGGDLNSSKAEGRLQKEVAALAPHCRQSQAIPAYFTSKYV